MGKGMAERRYGTRGDVRCWMLGVIKVGFMIWKYDYTLIVMI